MIMAEEDSGGLFASIRSRKSIYSSYFNFVPCNFNTLLAVCADFDRA
jgi:hypothetical protein